MEKLHKQKQGLATSLSVNVGQWKDPLWSSLFWDLITKLWGSVRFTTHGNSTRCMHSPPEHLVLQTLAKFTSSQGIMLLMNPWWQDASLLLCAPSSSMPGSDTAESTGDPVTTICVMDILHRHISALILPMDIATFVASSICTTSQGTYESAWRSWTMWCSTNGVDYSDFSDVTLICYLLFLVQEP